MVSISKSWCIARWEAQHLAGKIRTNSWRKKHFSWRLKDNQEFFRWKRSRGKILCKCPVTRGMTGFKSKPKNAKSSEKKRSGWAKANRVPWWDPGHARTKNPKSYCSLRALGSYWSKGVLSFKQRSAVIGLAFLENHFPPFCMFSLGPQYSASGANDTCRICKCEKKAISVSGFGGFVYDRIQLSNGGCQPLRN